MLHEIFVAAPQELTHSGVSTVAAREEIELSCMAVFELNIDAGSIFTNGTDAVAENGLDLLYDNIEDGFCEIASRQAKEKRFQERVEEFRRPIRSSFARSDSQISRGRWFIRSATSNPIPQKSIM